MRVATIDIGTNTTLLLVAERQADGSLVAVEDHAVITRLGQGVDRTKRLAPEAVARTKEALERYAGIIRAAGASKIAVVGTSAMRDAGGSEDLRAFIQDRLGVEPRVIGGDEEAELAFTGALSGLGLTGEVVVFDVGGGSTEVVHGFIDASGASTRSYARSFDVGSVRLTERHVRSDPPAARELDAVRADAERAFSAVPAFETKHSPVGIAGTMTTLAAVALGMQSYDGARVHGHVMKVAELRGVVDRLAAAPLEARRETPGLEPKRADVIVAGGLVALAFLARLGASTVMISDRGVRWGLARALCA
jgi:exopolyphosphatase/guanosine-5'-triphosphate,3'-diphosphate pyrophosphatase